MPDKTSKRYIAPSVKDLETKQIVDKIYDDLNSLADAVASPGDETTSKTTGQSGDTRVVNDRATSRIVLQGRTQDGWVELTSVSSEHAFDKPSE